MIYEGTDEHSYTLAVNRRSAFKPPTFGATAKLQFGCAVGIQFPIISKLKCRASVYSLRDAIA